MNLRDPFNAFCRHTHVELDGAPTGPLSGLSFAVKDVFDIAGQRTGNGHPVWLETHEPASHTASSVVWQSFKPPPPPPVCRHGGGIGTGSGVVGSG